MTRLTALIFAKYPQAGCVNTRMVPPLTCEEAAGLHRASLCACCERAVLTAELDVKLVITPDARVAAIRRMVGDARLDYWPQGDGDLGARLQRATDRAFDTGVEGVILLGSDSPTLPRNRLADAVTGLADHDAVLGPCDDGGYYLLGLRRPLPVLFARIDWGGPRVAEQTRQRAADAGASLMELPAWYDLDRFEDLSQAARDLAAVRPPAGSAREALRGVIATLLEKYSNERADPPSS